MLPTQQGSVRLFRVLGIDVWLHWSWALIAIWAIQSRRGVYVSEMWNVIEYLSLFGIVLLHEFGHALACRQVGGQANRIVLWPLGGVAYVAPPQRAGAQLWSIVAGPLVNLALVPLIYYTGRTLILTDTFMGNDYVDFWAWLTAMKWINISILVFNLLPIYPLDGGQIVRCLLWFGVGPRRSLLWASGAGLIGAAGLGVLALWTSYWWMAIMAAFLGINSWRAFQDARLG